MSAQRNPGHRNDPWSNHYFSLEINGKEIAHFQEFSGMKTSTKVFEIEEGGYNGHVHERPAQSTWENLVLKYASNVNMDLLEWRDRYLQDEFGSRVDTSGAVVMRDLTGKEIRRYNFVNAWPVSWEGPQISSGGSELSIETLEIAHEGIYVDTKPAPTPEPPPPEPVPERLDLPPIHFANDSDVLTQQGKDVCAFAASELDRMEIEHIWIEGHTSTPASWAHNLSLSQRRAAAVVREVSAQSENKNRQYYSEGFSWKYPVASNATEGGRASNRRTEFMTTSFDARGVNSDKPPNFREAMKYDPPWNHRD